MSVVRSTGEKCDLKRTATDQVTEFQLTFLRLHPRKHKWWIVWYYREKHGWTWRELSHGVSLSRGHCSRVFYRMREMITAVAAEMEQTSPGVARRILEDDDCDD